MRRQPRDAPHGAAPNAVPPSRGRMLAVKRVPRILFNVLTVLSLVVCVTCVRMACAGESMWISVANPSTLQAFGSPRGAI